MMIDIQDFTIDSPGTKVQLPSQILQELVYLDERRYGKHVPFFGGHPLSLTKKDQNTIFDRLNEKKQSPYLVCQKTDGVRYVLIVTNDKCYFVSRQGSRNLVAYETSVKIGRNWSKNPKQQKFQQIVHILDGEMIKDLGYHGKQDILRYLIFDALVCFNKLIINCPLSQRLVWINRFVQCNKYLLNKTQDIDQNAIEVKVKDFFRLTTSNYVSSSEMRRKNITQPITTIQFMMYHYMKCLPHQNDGLIFNDQTKPYVLGRNQGYLKWKPAHLNTVDFLIVHNENLQHRFGKRVMDLYLGWRDPDMTSNSVNQNVYRMIFYNFTIVEEHQYEDLKELFEKKYQAAFDNNPNEVTDEHFGLIAQCKYETVTDQLKIFKQLFSSSRDPQEIRDDIMKPRNQQKQMATIKKLQGEPCTKFWKIHRMRNDKNKPNDHEVVHKIEQSIKDDIKVESLIKKNKQLLEKTRI